MKVAVVGAYGRMGSIICPALEAHASIELIARFGSGDDVELLPGSGADVVVDVTTTTAARKNLPLFAVNAIPTVVGTTGFTAQDVEFFDAAFKAGGAECLLVPNFSIGAVLMMRFAEAAAPYFDGVEIIEQHHNAKRDAPSGTAQLTAERIERARVERPWAPDVTEHETAPGARGGEAVAGIRVHSVRLPGLTAHQEVIFGSLGQTLTLRHDNYDRAAYGPGVVRAVEGVRSLPNGVTVGLDAVLDT